MFIGTKIRADKIEYDVTDDIVIDADKIQHCTTIENLGVIFDIIIWNVVSIYVYTYDKLNTLTQANKAKLDTATLIYKYLQYHRPAYLVDMFIVNTNSIRVNGRLKACRPRTTFDQR